MPQKKSLRCISWKWGSLVGKTMEIQVFFGGVGHTSQLLEAGEPKLRSLPCMGATRRLQRALSQRRRPKALLKNILMIRAWTHTMFLISMALNPCPRILQFYVSQCGCRPIHAKPWWLYLRAANVFHARSIPGLCRAWAEGWRENEEHNQDRMQS